MRKFRASKPSAPPPGAPGPSAPAVVEAVWLLPLVLMPVAVNRLAPYPYAADRRLLLHVFGAAAATLLALDALAWFRRRLFAPQDPHPAARSGVRSVLAVLFAGAALLAIRCLTALSGLCPADSFLGLPARDGGLLSQLSCAAILLAALAHVRERIQLERILIAVFLGSIGPIIVGTLQAFGVPVFTPESGFPEGRIWGTFGNAIMFGSYLAGALPATLWTAWRAAQASAPDGARRVARAAVPALCAILDVWLLVRTGSRGPLLAAAAAGGLGLVLTLRRAGARNAAKALACAIALGIALFIGGVQLVAKSDSVQSMRRRGMVSRFNTVEVRLMLYEAMTGDVLHPRDASPGAAFRDPRARWRPWIGYGPDCLTYPLLRGLGPKLELAEGLHRVPDSTHGATMDALGGSGLAGLAALVALLGAVLCVAARAARLGIAAPRRRRIVAAALPLAGTLVGAVGMALLWGGHTWALGALAGGYVGVLAAIAGLMRRNVPGDPPARLPNASNLVSVAAFCMAASIWIDAQFALWASTSALLLHAGLAIVLLSATLEPAESPASPPPAAPSPFGFWCIVLAVASFAWLGLSLSLHFRYGLLPTLHNVAAFQRWLAEDVATARSFHTQLAALVLVPLVIAAMMRLVRRNSTRLLADFLGMALPIFVATAVACREWRGLESDIRLAGSDIVSNGGLPNVAQALCPPNEKSLTARSTWLYGQKWRVWLAKTAKSAPAADRAAAWNRAMRMADACAATRPFDGTVVRAAADVCLSAASASGPDGAAAARWTALAISRLHVALALIPGSNTLRQRLAKAVYDRDGGDSPALRAVFDEMLAIEPENPVAHSMLAQFALTAAVSAPDRTTRLAHSGEAVRHARRALASPTRTINSMDVAAVRATLDAALAVFRREGATPPPAPPTATSHAAPLEAPHLPAGRRRLAGAFGGAALAALVSFLLVPPVRWLARRTGWLDAPAARKVHCEPTPLLGGLAILAGVWVATLALPSVPLARPFGAVLGIATALAVVGVVDDRWPLPWQLKIAAQFAAALALHAAGVRVQLAWLPRAANVALTLFWLIGVTNAVNFLDNMNGLSNGLAAWSAAAISAIALVCGEWDVAAAALALAGACAGFLRGNNPWRGSVFMGDTGSLFLGLSLASLALLLRFPNNANWVTWLCPVLLLAVPVFDMTHVCLARLRRGRNPFSTPGKDHTSHLFERMGLSRPNAVLAVHALVLLCAAATWVVSFSSPIVAYAMAGAILAGAVFLLVYFELRFGVGGSDEYRDARAGFSLLEMLAVIAILGLLAGLGAPMIINAQRQARQADCRSNLRQFGIALAAYRSDHNGLNPPWLSNLYPEYIDGKDVYICKSDRDVKKKNLDSYSPFPSDFPTAITDYSKSRGGKDGIQDFDGGNLKGRMEDIKRNSYFYEFSAAPCSWDSNTTHDVDGDGEVAWWEAKEWQLRYGDSNNGGGDPSKPKPYSTARMPIIRCWHHGNEDKVAGYGEHDGRSKLRGFPLVLNVGYAGNVFASPPWWEGRPDVGDR